MKETVLVVQVAGSGLTLDLLERRDDGLDDR